MSYKAWIPILSKILDENNEITIRHANSRGNPNEARRNVGGKTRYERRRILFKAFHDLWKLGFKIADPHNFDMRHFTALCKQWEDEGLSASQIQSNVSACRALCAWIKKYGMIKETQRYFSKASLVKRSYTTTEDKTWTGSGIDVMAKIEEIYATEPRVGMSMELQLVFGLRVKESILLKPHVADLQQMLAVNWGTKGKRPRVTPVDEDIQKEVLDRAKALVTDQKASLVPPGYTFLKWKQHYYYVCKKHGLTRKGLAITSHGLRHEFINAKHEKLSGVKSPLKGGGLTEEFTREQQKMLQLKLSEMIGHSRPQIMNAYTSSISAMDKKRRAESMATPEEIFKSNK